MKRFGAAVLAVVGAAAILTVAPSCSNDASPSRVCIPGRTVSCTCDTGGEGLHSCRADGTGYEPCSFCKDVPNIGVEAGFVDVSAELGGLEKGVGPCVGFDDFDGDGDEDAILSAPTTGAGAFAPAQVVIYENLGAGKFSPQPVGKLLQGLSLLCTSADFDRDGLPDVVIKADTLDDKAILAYFKNLGKFQFQQDDLGFDIVPLDDHMVLGMGKFDANNDGWLDLVIGRSHGGGPSTSDACKMLENDFVCESAPYPGSAGPVVYRNDNGRFKLMPFMLNGPFPGTTNALAFADLDGNGLTDVVMANDWFSNHVHLQKNPGQFSRAETALGFDQFNHGMGIAVNDFDLDGYPDVFITDLGPNNLWFGSAAGTFENLNKQTGISAVTRYHSNWASIAEDFNLNGLPDIFVASSGVVTNDEDMVKMAMVLNAPINDLVPQFDLLFWNHGNREFKPITLPHRGKQNPFVIFGTAATADYDADGDMDVLVSTGEGLQMRFLRNEQPPGNYLTVELTGKQSNPHGIGAVVELMKSGIVAQRRYAGTGGSLGTSWHKVHFGLGESPAVDGVRVRWPGGNTQTVTSVTANRTLKIIED
jgi:hypothetical protein